MDLITHEELLKLLRYEPETGRFYWLVNRRGKGGRAGEEAGSFWKREGRWFIKIEFVTYQRSRLAWFYMKGQWPERLVDHHNRVKLDDRWENLRLATYSQNAMNAKVHSDNTSGVKGVCWNKKDKRWKVYIGRVYLGYFKDFEEAAKVAIEARQKHFGEFNGETTVIGGSATP